MKVTISILLATYNGEKYLPELLASLEAQTYPPIELVCCDDVSTDGTLGILEEFATRSKIQVKIFQNKKNKGYVKNFLEGFSLCSGDYVALCDQDDVWKPEKLEAMAARINPDLTPSMVFSDCELVNSNLNALNKTAFDFSGITHTEREKILKGNLIEILINHPLVPGMCMLVNRKCTLLNLPKNYTLMHDHALSLGFSIGGDYSFVETPLVLYRQHSKNAIGMRKKRYRKSLKDIFFKRNINEDLDSKMIIINYILSFTVHSNVDPGEHRFLARKISDTILIRRERRRSIFALLLKPIPEAMNFSNNQKRSIWFKDARAFLRNKLFHSGGDPK
jgi:glycosyltransferase involved in cell wall biosynthesis